MPRLILVHSDRPLPRLRRRALTLVEMLVAMAITLVMMAAVVNVFETIGTSVNNSRATIEMSGRLRGVRNRLQTDLASTTCPLLPWTDPASGLGYFEYIEGVHNDFNPTLLPLGTDSLVPSTSLGDYDDVLMFTISSPGELFVGRFGAVTRESKVAEVIWYAVENDGTTGIAGLSTIYRRVLLIQPSAVADIPDEDLDLADLTPEEITLKFAEFQSKYDISAHIQDDRIVLNSLGDVTKRENRFWHGQESFPHALPSITGIANSIGFTNSDTIELSGAGPPDFLTAGFAPGMTIKIRNSSQNDVNRRIATNMDAVLAQSITIDTSSGTLTDEPFGEARIVGYPTLAGGRLGEDVMLTNVLAFDVRAYDPGAPLFSLPGTTGTTISPGDPSYQTQDLSTSLPVGYGAYVDLNYFLPDYDVPDFTEPDKRFSGIQGVVNPTDRWIWDGTPPEPSDDDRSRFLSRAKSQLMVPTYDTWSILYRGIDGMDGLDTFVDNFNNDTWLPGSDGLDDGTSAVDDHGEWETSPPYPVPLRGIQVRIRVYEPDSRSVREVSINQHFVPE